MAFKFDENGIIEGLNGASLNFDFIKQFNAKVASNKNKTFSNMFTKEADRLPTRTLSTSGEFQGFRADKDYNVYGLVPFDGQDNLSNFYGNNKEVGFGSINAKKKPEGEWVKIEGFKLDKDISSGDIEIKDTSPMDVKTKQRDTSPDAGMYRDLDLRIEDDGSLLGAFKNGTSDVGYIRQALAQNNQPDNINLRSNTHRKSTQSQKRRI